MIDPSAAFDRAFVARAPALGCRPERAFDADFLKRMFIACSPLATILPEPMLVQQAEFQLTAHNAAHPRAMQRVVTLGDQPIGRIMVDWEGAEVYGVDIAVLPEFRATGAGLHMLRAWVAVIDLLAMPARLEVRDGNPAEQLYSRLGFVRTNAEDPASPMPTMLRPATSAR